MGNLTSILSGGVLFKGLKKLFEKPKAPEIQKQVLRAPSSAIAEDDELDDISLGSDRARTKKGRSKGRRQLMTPQTTQKDSSSNNTGLQI